MKAKGHKFEVIFFSGKKIIYDFQFYTSILTYDFCLKKKRIKFVNCTNDKRVRENDPKIVVLTFCMNDNIKISFLFSLKTNQKT